VTPAKGLCPGPISNTRREKYGLLHQDNRFMTVESAYPRNPLRITSR
jgi:hypothetical protein